MFNNHTITLVTDLRMVQNDLLNIDFVAMFPITTTSYPDYPNVHYAGILLPPTEILMDWADGKPGAMQIGYPQYLANEKECDDMIIAILALLTKKNIILYIPLDEFNVFGPYLLNHLYYTYGVTCNTPTTRFSIHNSKIPFIITKFFMMNTLSASEYLDMYPAMYPLPDIVINKLAIDLRPFGDVQATYQQYSEYFNRVNASKVGAVKVNMIRDVDKK